MLLIIITKHLNIPQNQLKNNVDKTTKHGYHFLSIILEKNIKKRTRSIDPQQNLTINTGNITSRANIFEVTSFSGG